MNLEDIDLTKHLKEALHILGCDPEKIGDFNHHSTIELSFTNTPSIFISREFDRDDPSTISLVWIWSRLIRLDGRDILHEKSEVFISELARYYPWLKTGQMNIIPGDEYLEFKGAMHEGTLCNPSRLSEALNEYYEILMRLSQALGDSDVGKVEHHASSKHSYKSLPGGGL